MFTQHLRSSAVKHVCFWHTCDRLPQNCFLYCDEYHFWAICKSFGVAQSFRQQFDLRTGERNTQKPLRNAMFVFNPFFSHCSHCLTSIERARSGLPPPPPCQLDWVAASSEAFLNTSLPLSLHSFGAASHSALHFCCVCGLLYFVLVFLFSVFFSAAHRSKVKWNFTPVADAPPHRPLLLIECLPEQQQQLLLLSNEWNAIKLMSMHVYSV